MALRFWQRKQELSRHQVSSPSWFSSVLTLICSLATAEMHMALAKLFRCYDFELFETERSDVDIAHDLFLQDVKQGSKGVRVMVTRLDR